MLVTLEVKASVLDDTSHMELKLLNSSFISHLETWSHVMTLNHLILPVTSSSL